VAFSIDSPASSDRADDPICNVTICNVTLTG
jgi:hypothetical protein